MTTQATRALSGAQGKQVAYDALKLAVSRGDLAPAQRLVEQELAEQYAVTRGSIRAALIDLSAEGLVERVPNRGSRVRVVSIDEAVAITEVRMMLEGLLAGKAAERATKDECRQLLEIGAEMETAVGRGDGTRYGQLNLALHKLVRDVGHQPVAADVLDRLNGQLVRHRFRLSQRDGRPRQSIIEHLEIINAVVAGDPDRATKAMHAHLLSVIEALKSTPEGQ
ncbi:GntR family transcriptional regulator [Knoellia sp. Soil729]|uniref:GntR family transcriptional regulator n=1 Tax=Knoellia sp. Soil729 TaxID=1736394 RepID=UPI0006F8321F|nr:GntR family transcriptional regulator [Knoellia sp. Soil729]KRE40793.1 GntR family transcriptional regulator [Knoellia sp. Soil729]